MGDILNSENEQRKPRVEEEDGVIGAVEEQRIKAFGEIAEFHRITIWGHENVLEQDDIFSKGIEEWIDFAEAMHMHKKSHNMEK